MIRRSELKLVEIVCALVLGAVALAPKSEGQAVPIPIALPPIAGTGSITTTASTFCAGNIPIYYKPNAGYVPQSEGDGCPASQVTLGSPGGVAVDSYGNVFFVDEGHYTVRVIYEGGAAVAQAIVNANVMNFSSGTTPVTLGSLVKGNIYLVAGSYSSATVLGPPSGPATPYYCSQTGSGATPNPSSSPLAGCPGGYAYLVPQSIALDADGNVFFTTQSGRHAVMVLYIGGTKAAKLIQAATPGTTGITTVTPGYMYIVAGTNDGATVGVYTPDGPLATNISEYYPRNIYIDSSENVYYPDMENNLIREVNGTTDAVTTVAGFCTLPPQDTVAPYLYPCESAQQLGLNTPAAQGDGGPASAAHFNYPFAVAFDINGNMFIADSGLNQNTTTTPVATPAGVIPGRVRVVYAKGTLPGITGPQVGYIYTYAGGGTSVLTNSPALNLTFDELEGVSVDLAGYLYVTDRRKTSTTSNRVWRVDPVTGIATIIVGGPSAGLGTSSLPSVVNCNTNSTTVGVGPTHTDKFGSGCPASQTPIGGAIGNFVFDKLGNAYAADTGYGMLHEYVYNNIFPATTAGATTTGQYVAFDVPVGVATTGLTFGVEGNGDAEFSDVGVLTDTCTAVKVFTADTVCSYDLKFSPAKVGSRYGTIQLATATGVAGQQFLSGTGVAGVLTIDPGTQGTLGSGIKPTGVAVDQLGNAYMSDSTGNQVLKIPTAGGVTTTLVTGLNSPGQIAVDGQGTVYIADTGNNRIVRKPVTGATTFLGTGLKAPMGVAVDFDGNVFVADTGNSRVVEFSAITANQTTLNVDVTTLSGPSSLSFDAAGNFYIVDAAAKNIIELPTTGGQQLLSIPGVSNPVAVAVDLSGNIFAINSATEQILELPLGGTSAVVALAGTAPVGLAIDATGSLYIADPGTVAAPINSFTTVNRTMATVVFPQTDIKSPGNNPSTFTLTSSGLIPVTLATPLDTSTNAAVFPIAGATANGCSPSEVLALGATCQVTGTFYPTVVGTQTATATFPSSTNSVFINESGKAVNLILTTVTLAPASPATVTVGTPVTVTATVGPSGTETGTVTFYLNGLQQGAPQNLPGTPSVTLSGLAVGTFTVKAVYSGDTVYSGSTGLLTLVVTKIPTTLAETVTQGNGGPTVTAAVTPLTMNGLTLTGTITFTVDGVAGAAQPFATASDGPLMTLANGAHTVCATYSGDPNFATSTICAPLTISRITTTINETEAQGSIGPTITAAITPTTANGLTATGTITFTVDGVAGAAQPFATASVGPLILTNGSHTIAAKYSGDGNFASSTTSLTININLLATTVVLSPVVIIDGGFRFTVTLTTSTLFTNGISPTGTLSVLINGVVVKTNTAIVMTPTTANGVTTYSYIYTSAYYPDTSPDMSYPLSATYTGDGNFSSSASAPPSPSTITVYHVPTATSMTVVRGAGGSVVSGTIVAPTPYYSGPPPPYTCATCSPAVSTAAVNPNFVGTVGIYRDGALVSTYTLSTTANGVYSYVDMVTLDGPHTFYAVYNGDGNYKSSTSTTSSITVLHAPTSTTLTTGGGGSPTGVPGIQLTATTTSTTAGIIAGTTNFYNVNTGNFIGSAPVVNGVAIFVTPTLVYSSYTFCSIYEGDGNYLPSTSNCATEGSDLAIAPTTPTTFNVPYQSNIPMTFNLASIDGYSGTLAPSCVNLPANVICRFDNQALVVNSTTQAVSNLVIYASINPNTASVGTGYSAIQLASIFGGSAGFALLLLLRRRGLKTKLPMLLCLLLMLGVSVGLSGCGNGYNQYTPVYITPAGTYNIGVAYTAANGFSRSVTLTLTFLPHP